MYSQFAHIASDEATAAGLSCAEKIRLFSMGKYSL